MVAALSIAFLTGAGAPRMSDIRDAAITTAREMSAAMPG